MHFKRRYGQQNEPPAKHTHTIISRPAGTQIRAAQPPTTSSVDARKKSSSQIVPTYLAPYTKHVFTHTHKHVFDARFYVDRALLSALHNKDALKITGASISRRPWARTATACARSTIFLRRCGQYNSTNARATNVQHMYECTLQCFNPDRCVVWSRQSLMCIYLK